MLVIIFHSYSRGPLLAVAGSLFVAAIICRDQKTIALFVCAILASVTWVWLGDQDPGALLARGTALRPQIWVHVWNEVLQAPLIGHGLLSDESFFLSMPDGNFRPVDHPHSIFVAMLFYGGLLGLILLIGLLASAFWQAISLWRLGQPEILILLLLALALGVTDNNKVMLL